MRRDGGYDIMDARSVCLNEVILIELCVSGQRGGGGMKRTKADEE